MAVRRGGAGGGGGDDGSYDVALPGPGPGPAAAFFVTQELPADAAANIPVRREARERARDQRRAPACAREMCEGWEGRGKGRRGFADKNHASS